MRLRGMGEERRLVGVLVLIKQCWFTARPGLQAGLLDMSMPGTDAWWLCWPWERMTNLTTTNGTHYTPQFMPSSVDSIGRKYLRFIEQYQQLSHTDIILVPAKYQQKSRR